jgi:hypothetical protein
MDNTFSWFLAAAAAGLAIGCLILAAWLPAPDPVRLEADRGIRELELYLNRYARQQSA